MAKLTRSLFSKHRDQWKKSTSHFSDTRRIAENADYKAIISYGEEAIPFIMRELESRPDHWFEALWRITHKNPVPHEHRGRIDLMAQDWLKWAKQNGYTW